MSNSHLKAFSYKFNHAPQVLGAPGGEHCTPSSEPCGAKSDGSVSAIVGHGRESATFHEGCNSEQSTNLSHSSAQSLPRPSADEESRTVQTPSNGAAPHHEQDGGR